MTQPVQMVFINIIASLIVIVGTLIYRYIYPKKKINLFVLLLIISILPIISVFRPGDYESGDFNIHIYRIMSFYRSLQEGILIPSWAGDLNATYGNPLFLFNYTLPYYTISLLHFIGLSFIGATKLYLGITLYLSGIFMYLFIKSLTSNKLASFSSGIFYIFAPYHLIDVHFRATLGESTIFTLTPLIFLFISKYSQSKKSVYLAIITLLIFLLFLAHPLHAGILIGVMIIYLLFTQLIKKDIKCMLSLVFTILLGFLISGYIWAPFIIYSSILYHFPNLKIITYYPFEQLFYSPWRLGLLFQGPKGELQTIIGYSQLFVILSTTLLLILNKFTKKYKIQVVFWTTLFFITLFLMNPYSNFVWIHIQFIGTMLTAYSRLSLILSFITSVVAGYFVLYLNKRNKLIYLLIFITIGYTILNWGQRSLHTEINDVILSKNAPYSTLTEGPSEYINTIWADSKNPWFSKIPQNHLEIIKGVGTVRNINWKTTNHDYVVNALTPIELKENTLYFPGWQVKLNNKLISSSPGYRGTINFKLPPGINRVNISYKDIEIEYLLKNIAKLSILFLMMYIVFYYLLKPLRFKQFRSIIKSYEK